MNQNIQSIAILLDGKSVQRWQHRAIQRMVQERNVTITSLIINNEQQESADDIGLGDFTAWNLYRALHRRFRDTPSYKEFIPLDEVDWAKEAETVYCEPRDSDGIGNELPEQAVETLSEADLAVRFGFGIVVGEALSAPNHGILSFHHGDITEYRGRPGGFWQFINKECTAGVTLQRLTETLDGGEIVLLEHVEISDAKTWPEVQERIYRTSDHMLSEGVKRLQDGASPDHADGLGDLYTNPSWRGMIRYVIEVMKRRL